MRDHWKTVQREPLGPPVATPTIGAGEDAVDLLVREAVARLGALQPGRQTGLDSLPAILFLGAENSGKTFAVANSASGQHLLAGHVFEDSSIVPTRLANIWLSQTALIIEVGSALLADLTAFEQLLKKLAPETWLRKLTFETLLKKLTFETLLKTLAPETLLKKSADLVRAVLAGGRRAPRAVVVCVSMEDFAGADSGKALGARARVLRSHLARASQQLGAALPFYVLFTHLDWMHSFRDFSAGSSAAMAGQVMGSTLRLQPAGDDAAGAEESRQLTEAFDSLHGWLTERRTLLLARERSQERLAGIYEFPRDFYKLRAQIVQFLIELSRPSPLGGTAMLRGFYFSGSRETAAAAEAPAPTAVPVAAAATAPALHDSPATVIGANIAGIGPIHSSEAATVMFRPPAAEASAPQPARAPQKNAVQQALFLTNLFNQVLLRDKLATGASSASRGVDLARRFAPIGALLVLFVWTLGLAVSFVQNRALAQRVAEAARLCASVSEPGAASEENLQRLEQLRTVLGPLRAYSRDGAPLRFRWGLYSGGAIYREGRRAYADAFSKVLFADTRRSLVDGLLRLPTDLSREDEYQPAYASLRAYLMLTSHHEKAEAQSLAPVLLRYWQRGRTLNADQIELASRQFEFFSEEQHDDPFFRIESDSGVVENARDYLRLFDAADQLYQRTLEEAESQGSSVKFNRQFPNAAGLVADSRVIFAPFTKPGWDAVQARLRNLTTGAQTEEWVLPAPERAAGDMAGTLRSRYQFDFLAEWRSFVRSASVAPYRDLQDAARKLKLLSDRSSPLLALFCLVSENTRVGVKEIEEGFQPARFLMQPGCTNRYVGSNNQEYMGALAALQSAIERAAQNPTDRTLAQQALASAGNARNTVERLAFNFRPDPEGGIGEAVKKLLLDPIANAEKHLQRAPLQSTPLGENGLCGEFHKLKSKYPFNPGSKEELSLEEFNAFFHPGSGYWPRFYEANLGGILVRQGPRFAAQAGAHVNPEFVKFCNNLEEITRLYSAGEPRLYYSLKAFPTPGSPFRFEIEGQSIPVTNAEVRTQLTWPGKQAQGAVLLLDQGFELAGAKGPWGAFRLFADATARRPRGSVYRVEWNLVRPNSKPTSFQAEVDFNGSPAILFVEYLPTFSCPAKMKR